MQSDSSTLEIARPKRLRKSRRVTGARQPAAETQSKDLANSVASGNHKKDSLDLEAASPKVREAQPSHASSQSPTREVVNAFAPPSSPIIASELSAYNDQTKPSPKASSISNAHLSPYVSQPHPFAKEDMNWPSSRPPPFRHQQQSPYQQSSLESTADNDNTSMTQQTQMAKHQQLIARLHYQQQLNQQSQSPLARYMTMNDPDSIYFVHNHQSFTLLECLLACALKNYCKFPGLLPSPTSVIGDETIAEVIMYQRGWRDAEGLECYGLCAALISPESPTHILIQDVMRGDHGKWESQAKKVYTDWMYVMTKVVAR